MNSTKNKAEQRRIEEFFNTHILPLHQQVKAGEKSYFDLVPRKELENDSYFEEPRAGQLTYYTFYDMMTQEELKANLTELWKNLGDDQIANLAGPLAELAMMFKTQNLDQSDELSPYVYAMF